FLLQTVEKQRFLIISGCVCGAIDIGLDFLLTPHYGATGAAIANGTAQTLGAVAVWLYISKVTEVKLPLLDFGRIAFCGAIMAAGVLTCIRTVPTAAGMALAIALGAVLWIVSMRATSVLGREDASRF